MTDNNEVFISYSWDSKDHIQKVLKFSDKLRSEGVDCILDQYEESPPEGWPRWMEKKIRESKYVLLICTETYYNRSLGNEEPSIGNGVKWEGALIFQHLYKTGSYNTKFIPVVFKDSDTQFVPMYVQGSTIYSLEREEGYDRLYFRLINQPRVQKPKLGERRSLPQKPIKTDPSMFIDTPNYSSLATSENIIDKTRLNNPNYVKNLSRINRILEWGNNAEELQWSANLLNEYIEQLEKVPKEILHYVGIFAERTIKMKDSRVVKDRGASILISDLKSAFGLGNKKIREVIDSLENYKLAYHGTTSFDEDVLSFYDLNGWEIWLEIAKFCIKTQIPMQAFTKDLNFSYLDDEDI